MALHQVTPYLICVNMIIIKYLDVLEGITITGFSVMSEAEAEEYEAIINQISWEFSHDFGDATIDYANGEALLSALEFRSISEENYDSINDLFEGTFGYFISMASLQNIISESDDSDEYPEDNEDY